MFVLTAILCILFGLSFLLKTSKKTREQKPVISFTVLGIGMIVLGAVMIYLVFSDKIILPLH